MLQQSCILAKFSKRIAAEQKPNGETSPRGGKKNCLNETEEQYPVA